MSSAELRLSKRASTAGSYIARSFFRTLMSFLVIDAVVMLCFDGALWQWLVLSGIEVVRSGAAAAPCRRCWRRWKRWPMQRRV